MPSLQRIVAMHKVAFDQDNPVDLFDRMMAILRARKIQIRSRWEDVRSEVVDVWEQRSTEVNWDWRPVAQVVSDWLTKNWRRPKNVWMTKYPGQPITIHFQDSGDINTPWQSKHQAKWKTLMGQLEKRFGLKEIGFEKNLFLLPDGKTKIQLSALFFGGTPTSETL